MKNPNDNELENKTTGGRGTETSLPRETDPIGTYTGRGHDGYDQGGADFDYVRRIPVPADSYRQDGPKVSQREKASENNNM